MTYCFSYFLQFTSEFCNKEFLIWAPVSSWFCFCWLCRVPPSLAFTCSCPLFLALFIDNTVFSALCILAYCVIYINWPQVHGFISDLSILFHWFIFCVSVSYYFDYYSFAVESEFRKYDFSSSVLLSQDCFDFCVLYRFFIHMYLFCEKNAIGNLSGISLNL